MIEIIKKTSVTLLVLITSLFLFGQITIAQETQLVQWGILLEKEDTGILPTNPFYFAKEWGRGIKKLFTFDSVKKAELELKYTDEKLVEMAKVVDKNCGESGSPEKARCNIKALQKALNNYLKSQEKLAKRLETLPQNKNIEELLNKLAERIILHQALFDELINGVPELEQRKEDMERRAHDTLKSVIQNIRRVGYSSQNIEQSVDKLPYGEGVRELKALEVLTRIEENLPEEAKKGIETAKEAIQKRLVESGEIQKAKDWKIEQGLSGWVSVEGVPVQIKVFEKVVEKIEEKAEEVSPVNQRLIETIKELKTIVARIRKAGSQGDYFPAASNFKLEIDGIIQAGFKEVSGIESETEVVEYQYPDDLARKRPGRTKSGNIVLRNGSVTDNKLSGWYKKVVGGATERKSISIIILDRAGREVGRYNLLEAFPIRFEGGDYSVEEVEFKVEGGVIIGKKLTPDKIESGSENIGRPSACPQIAPDISKGEAACLNAAKTMEEKYPGCSYALACKAAGEKCGPAPGAPGQWRCVDGKWADVSQCGKIQCIRYDPVCGADGKTYACGEIDVLSCGVKVAYKGECEFSPTSAPDREPAASPSIILPTKQQ